MFPSEVAPEVLGSTTQASFVCVFSGVLSFFISHFINELRSSGDVSNIFFISVALEASSSKVMGRTPCRYTAMSGRRLFMYMRTASDSVMG